MEPKKEKRILERIFKFERIWNYASYDLFIIVGIFMVLGTLGKLLGIYNISSDWFWFLAGLGLILEGVISLLKQRKFDKKFKIIKREELVDIKSLT